jgi:hypothetical protein
MGTENVFIPLTSSLNEGNNLPSITISAPGYESVEKIPYKGDGTIKENLGIIKLTPTQDALELDKIESSQLSIDQIKELNKEGKTPEYFAQKKLTDLVINLKGKAIPLTLTLISSFGITKVSQLIDKEKTNTSDLFNATCPSPEELTRLINRKNKLVKQINRSFKIIDSTTKALGITQGIITSLQIAITVGLAVPFPVPASVPVALQRINTLLERLNIANAGILAVLILTRQVLTQLLQYLNLLDSLIQQCSPDTDQEQISAELTALTIQQTQQESPVVTNVNGFEMGVETEPTTNSLKRRRAIARNKQGIVMLKGEYSFSSIDQILIDELVFYIQQNDLKAE